MSFHCDIMCFIRTIFLAKSEACLAGNCNHLYFLFVFMQCTHAVDSCIIMGTADIFIIYTKLNLLLCIKKVIWA